VSNTNESLQYLYLLYTYPPQSDRNAIDRRCWSPVKTWRRKKRLILQGILQVADVVKSRKTATLTARSSIGTISVLPWDYERAEGRGKKNKRITMASFHFSYTDNFCARAHDTSLSFGVKAKSFFLDQPWPVTFTHIVIYHNGLQEQQFNIT